jgi:predicted ATPase/DNA-binding winged helix-turn-helix (wHTH) protein
VDDRTIVFGPFRLLAERRLLLEGETPVRLGSRALDILLVLLERPGELVPQADLIARVWPDTIVEDATLRVHIAALRRALGEGQDDRRFLLNVPGRGYRFILPAAGAASSPTPSARVAQPSESGLPVLLSRLVGRDEVIDALAGDVGNERLVSIVGPGGIGKTSVALSVAHRIHGQYRDGARFIDLAPLADASLLPRAIAVAAGMGDIPEDPLPRLLGWLRDKQILVVLDSCEHIIGAAAQLAEEVLRIAPDVHILTTSREPLRAEGERVHRLAPLRAPANSTGLTAADALAYPAVRLFVERAAASADGFVLSDNDAAAVADICRKLDGIALAIELAAGRIDTLAVQDMARILDDRLALLTRGRRTALPRHRTLTATLDWSHDLLSDTERMVLRRLGVFAGWFSAEAAVAAVGLHEGVAGLEDIAGLINKSLVAADVSGTTAYYRLLDTTRAYALEKLADAGESNATARRHAEHYRDLLERAQADWERLPTKTLLSDYGRQLDNVRVALDWSFGSDGDTGVAMALTAAAVPLWKHLSLMEECRARVNQALTAPRQDGPGTVREMQLSAALGATLLSTISSSGAEIATAWTRTLEIAEALGDVDYQLRALWGLWLAGYHSAQHRKALGLAERHRVLAATHGRRSDELVGDRMKGVSLLLLGQLGEGRQLIQRAVEEYLPESRGADILKYQFDQSVTAKTVLCQALWLQGFPVQAFARTESTVAEAIEIGHVLSICDTLVQAACPISLRVGNLEAAERYTSMLIDYATRNELRMWQAWGRCFRGILFTLQGQLEDGARVLRQAMSELPPRRFVPRQLALLGALADCECRAGLLDQGLDTIDSAIALSVTNEEIWCLGDLHRTKGELLVEKLDAGSLAAAEEEFRKGVAIAAAQGSLMYELQSATCLARLLRSDKRRTEAREVLEPVYLRLTEGHDIPRVKEAQFVLESLD